MTVIGHIYFLNQPINYRKRTKKYIITFKIKKPFLLNRVFFFRTYYSLNKLSIASLSS
ncbi:hypothetical protein PSSA1_v1c0800 [Candidatus Phytoplasma solani]|uniref:Uncharacterized protein n=1 Tax=Candidatus Phytoplasma solani TaxID=69896 RepID=A0A421NYY7_9MOLU|nr:hypothetical protein PSSA1_v1c0620 [Candidatus Phytoplasma solani]RMI89200.1 hypothetical protein PSSA1_v1c0800 [Candidatus Phytoplasma solani]